MELFFSIFLPLNENLKNCQKWFSRVLSSLTAKTGHVYCFEDRYNVRETFNPKASTNAAKFRDIGRKIPNKDRQLSRSVSLSHFLPLSLCISLNFFASLLWPLCPSLSLTLHLSWAQSHCPSVCLCVSQPLYLFDFSSASPAQSTSLFVSLVCDSLLVWLSVSWLVRLFFLSMLPAPFPLISVRLTLWLSASVSLFVRLCLLDSHVLLSLSLAICLYFSSSAYLSVPSAVYLFLRACMYLFFLFRLVIRSFCLCLSLCVNLSVSPSFSTSHCLSVHLSFCRQNWHYLLFCSHFSLDPVRGRGRRHWLNK